ncbi:MAG: hypothetical protein AB7R89_12535 [Dehalococcoidia bacterium]
MTVDSLRFDGTVFDHSDVTLGEARFWGSAERSADGSSWRGWIRVTDLGTNELIGGRYRVRSSEGWEAEFEPLAGRPSRVFEIDLLPIQGIGEAPWPDQRDAAAPRYQPLWNDAPPRVADDRSYFPDLSPLGLVPQEGLLPPDLTWAPVPDEPDALPK